MKLPTTPLGSHDEMSAAGPTPLCGGQIPTHADRCQSASRENSSAPDAPARNLGRAGRAQEDVTDRLRHAQPSRSNFLPTWVDELELCEPVTDRPVPRQEDGQPYARASLLVRRATVPLGFIEMDLSTDQLPAAQVHDAVREHYSSASQRTALSSDRPRKHHQRAVGAGTAADISVVVCTRDRPDSVRTTLVSLLRTTPGPLEVLVVDNAPATDDTRALVHALDDPRLTYVIEPTPGLSRARNRGLAEARGAIVAFTDDDVIVDSLWLGAIHQGFSRAQGVACVTGLVAPAELDTPAQHLFESKVTWSSSCTPQIWDLSSPPADDVLFPFTVGKLGAGANFALRQDRVGALGRFDEALGAGTPSGGGEDLDMFLRVLLHGFKLAYEPEALVWHRHRRDADKLHGQMFSYGAGLSAYAYKQLREPTTRAEVARRIPRALLRSVHLTRRGGSEVDSTYRGLARAQLLGYACGPVLYLQGRRRLARRDPRPSGQQTLPTSLRHGKRQ